MPFQQMAMNTLGKLGPAAREAIPAPGGQPRWRQIPHHDNRKHDRTDPSWRPYHETNSITHRAAYGRLNGPATTTISILFFFAEWILRFLLTTEIAGELY